MTTVRGITSRVDIVWKKDGLCLVTAERLSISYPRDNLAIYTFAYTTPQLSITDDGSVYQCEVAINTSPPISSAGSITLDVTGILKYYNSLGILQFFLQFLLLMYQLYHLVQ